MSQERPSGLPTPTLSYPDSASAALTWVSYQCSASLRLFSTKVSYWHLISSRTRFRSTGGAASTSTLSRSPSWQRREFTSCGTDEGLFQGGCLAHPPIFLPVLTCSPYTHLLALAHLSQRSCSLTFIFSSYLPPPHSFCSHPLLCSLLPTVI